MKTMIPRVLCGILLMAIGGCCEMIGNCEEEYGKVGCYASSYGTGTGYGTSIGTTLQNANYDRKMNQEVDVQRMFFSGVPASVWILNEGGPQYRNAYASPDGHILFGYHMFYYIVQSFNELAVAGVLAHEWGHRTQFVHEWPTQNPLMELEADAFSGYYMGLAKQWAWSQIRGYYANTYATGDYNFNHPTHHGTPDQRLAAAYLGVNMAVKAIRENKPFSYQELHQVFSQQLAERVTETSARFVGKSAAPAVKDALQYLDRLDVEGIVAGASQGQEVEYPRRLSEEELLRLRPFSQE